MCHVICEHKWERRKEQLSELYFIANQVWIVIFCELGMLMVSVRIVTCEEERNWDMRQKLCIGDKSIGIDMTSTYRFDEGNDGRTGPLTNSVLVCWRCCWSISGLLYWVRSIVFERVIRSDSNIYVEKKIGSLDDQNAREISWQKIEKFTIETIQTK